MGSVVQLIDPVFYLFYMDLELIPTG